jgi:hypothetical protein
MKQQLKMVAAAVSSALALGGAVAAATTGGGAGARAAGPDCPAGALRLQAAAFGPASEAALASQRGRYEDMGTRPLVTGAMLAGFDRARGTAVRRECGRTVSARTVVVYLESASARFRRRNPSLSQGVVFVSRLPGDGYRVWRVVR